jgi:hypothetical protein
MKSLDEIHDMIATAQLGDGDRVLDICQALLEQIRDLRRSADHFEQVEDTRQWIQGNPSY